MSAISGLLEEARRDEPVYICRVREVFEKAPGRALAAFVHLLNGETRRFVWRVPTCETAQEREFVQSYLNAMFYNLLSSLGAREIRVAAEERDPLLEAYAAGLNRVFQTDEAPARRKGYGKCLNVNGRVLASLGIGEPFRFSTGDFETLMKEEEVTFPARRFRSLRVPDLQGRALAGVDVGGSDIKAVVSWNGELCGFVEYDWNPDVCTRAEALIEPIAGIVRCLRAAASLRAAGLRLPGPIGAAGDFAAWAAGAEALLGDRLLPLDGIGVSFPDVVIRDRIVGGETHKTRGIRENPSIRYEEEFLKISALAERLRPWVRDGAPVRCANDGNMAAFTAAMERTALGGEVDAGYFAHSLGTELGSGWVLPDGTMPEIPLEIYNFVADLGSFDQRSRPPRDLRSTRSVTTGLAGSLQRSLGQAGAFRLAAKILPDQDPALWRAMLAEGLVVREAELLRVPGAPTDRRKACLARLMEEAENPASPAAEIFRTVGEALGAVWLETQYLLRPACGARTLYGRMVKTQRCFSLLWEGAGRIAPNLPLERADAKSAGTPLMQQLAKIPDLTAAQFGQAVGAAYFAARRAG